MEITKNKIEAQNFYTISISQFFPPLDKKLDADDVCVSKKLLKYLLRAQIHSDRQLHCVF